MPIASDCEPDEWQTSESAGRTSAPPLCLDVVVAHPLPAMTGRVAVQKRDTTFQSQCLVACPPEISGVETGVAVDLSLVMCGQQYGVDERRSTQRSIAWRPESKAEIFLAVSAKQMTFQDLMHVGAHGHSN